MGKKKRQTLYGKLSFDGDHTYTCQHPLGGTPIPIYIMFIGCEPDDLQTLADQTEALLREWPTLRKAILKAAQDELVACRYLQPGDEARVTLASLVPFSFTVTKHRDADAFYGVGIDIPDILDEIEYFEYCSDFANTHSTVQIRCTE